MSQRRTYTRSSGSRTNRQTSYRKPASSKYQPSRNPSRPPVKRGGGGGGARILLVVLLVAVVAVGAVLIIKNLPQVSASAVNMDTIIDGITIDGINVAGMSKDQAFAAVEQAGQTHLNNISITFRYNDKSWVFTADELKAALNIQSIVDQAFETGKTGTAKENREVQEVTRNSGLALTTKLTVDRDVLVEALQDVKNEIDQPMVEASITFDASNYNGPEYLMDKDDPTVDMTKAMFTITPGTVGYVMDYDKALQELNDALASGWTADITLSVKEEHPKYTVEELEECTTLIYHSSSKNTHRDDADRNHNLEKALGFFKGMVLMPGDIVDYNLILGERTFASGWLEANTITQEKTLEKALGGGICQIATTLYNAAFMANCKIIDRGPHSWPGYREDFGYGMDAMVNWDTDELIFQNDSEYPMFINTYIVMDAYNRLGYVDVDIFTMPQKDENGNILHIRPESNVVKNEPIGEPTYKEVTTEEPSGATWKLDSNLGKMVYTYRASKNRIEVDVYKVWYKDSVQDSLGVWAGGVEVKREPAHYDIYAGVTAIIYTKPTPTPAPVVTPAPATS